MTVSVIVPVYNCRSTIARCVDSALGQTLTDLELICVDDGSTDGSGALLDALTDPRVTVVHQANSGGPGAPRNAALEVARGEYVFFLDSDDWLGPEALERMVAAARENDTEIVIGRYVGVGRQVPVRLFRETVARTTIEAPVPDLYATLAPLKLFRRDLIKDLRFIEGLLSHEDQEFTATAYFRARGVTVLADYDYYFWVEREDGTSVLQRGGAPDHDFFPAIERVMRVVEEHTEPGPARERMLRRNFRVEIMPRFGAGYLASDDADRRVTEEGALALVRAHMTPGIAARLSPFVRQVAHCLEHGSRELLREIVAFAESGEVPALDVRDGHAYERTPGYGTLPDSCFDVTDRLPFKPALKALEWSGSRLVITGVLDFPHDGLSPLSLVLRDRRHPERELSFPLEGIAEFRYGLDLEGVRLERGLWDVLVTADFRGIPLAERLAEGEAGEPGLRFAQVAGAGQPTVRPYFTRVWRNLSIDAGGARGPEEIAATAQVERGELTVHGRIPAAGREAVTLRLVGRLRGDGATRGLGTTLAEDGTFTAVTSIRDWQIGIWRLDFEVAAGDAAARGSCVPVGSLESGSAGVRRKGIPYLTNGGKLAIKIADRPLMPRIVRRLTGQRRR
ncbi:glycosyltransferase family 2 protein [Actinocorallia longicatena]|uniref:glycosyltransferase family 2 protein n=1 Tax=Actinocorallia longicatena TaxID=111803 RepID=UPI0031E041FF